LPAARRAQVLKFKPKRPQKNRPKAVFSILLQRTLQNGEQFLGEEKLSGRFA
jgi:hypothetical protein